jgi:hypothetical protein
MKGKVDQTEFWGKVYVFLEKKMREGYADDGEDR